MPDAFVAFYGRYYGVVLRIAQQRLGGLADAEDVTSEVFRVAWTHYKSTGSVELPWVYQTLRNMVGHEYRRRSRGTSSLDDEALNLIISPVENGGLEGAVVRAHLRGLAVEDREVLFMAYWEDLTTIEMAQILGCSAAAVRVRLFRARRRLALRLKQQVDTTWVGGA